jgi:hypothetical protein
MTKKSILLIFLFFLVISAGLFAQDDNLTIKIAIMGPGDQLYFWWGHIALMVEDSTNNTSYLFDYGLFSFASENFFTNFAFGRLLYCCGVSYSERNFNLYRKHNRDITVYTLNLPPETKIKVRDFVVNNVLPENCDYYYHHFLDNCSTRIRDIIGIATDGQFKRQFGDMKSDFTFRDHVRRHTYFSPIADWILSFWMGQVIDRQIRVWDDMFLPSEIGRRIENFYYTDSDGNKQKLVTSIENVYKAKNHPMVLEKPRKQWIYELTFSLVLSLIFAFFFFLQTKNIKAGRIMAGFSMSLCGLVFGFAGLTLYFLNLFTNHDYTYQNMNMIFCTPLLLAAVPFGILYALTKNQKKLHAYGELLRFIWFLSVLGILISMIIKILPQVYQDNLTDQLLMLPIALIFTLQPIGLKETIKRYFPGKKHGAK